jgi:hypothetical protein
MGVGVLSPPPPAVTEPRPSGGGGSGWIYLARARDDIDAHLLTGRLSQAGIETRTIVDRSAPGAWLHGGSNPWAPVNIFVRRHQLDDARLVLAEISFGAPPAGPPGVGAQRRRLPVLWWVTAVALGLVLTVVALGQAMGGDPLCRALPFCQESQRSP